MEHRAGLPTATPSHVNRKCVATPKAVAQYPEALQD